MGLALQVADVLGYKPTAEESQQANLRSLNEERGRAKDPKSQKVLDDEIASITGTKTGGLGDQVTAELMGNPAPRQPVPRGTAPIAAQTPTPTAQDALAATESATPKADAFRNDPHGKGLPEVAASVVSGLGSSVAGGLYGLYKLATTGSADEAAQAVRSTQEAGTYQPKSASGKAAVEVLGSRANPLNWIPEAGKKVAEKGFEAGVLDPSDAALIEAGSTMLSPAALLKGGALFKRGAKPAPGETSPFGSAGSAAASNATAVKAAAENASPQLKQVITAAKEVHPEAVKRQLEGDSLPEPVQLTSAQARGNVVDISNEYNSQGKFKQISERYNEQETKLKNNINLIRDEAAPDVFGTNPTENGQALIDHYREIDNRIRADVTAKYKALEDANGGKFPVDGVAFVDAAEAALGKKLKTDFVPTPIARQMERFKSGEPMTFEQFEAMRTNLAAEMRKAERSGDGNAAMASGIVREALENIPLAGEASGLKGIADTARSAAKARFDLIKKDPAYKAVVDDRAKASDFINKFVVRAEPSHVQTMVQHLGEGSPAHQTMTAGVINHLKEKSGMSGVDNGSFNQSGYNKALEQLRPKLLTIAGAKTSGQLETLGNVARYTQELRRGNTANVSKTTIAAHAAEGAKNIAEHAVNIKTGSAIGTNGRKWMANRAQEKAVNEALKPGAGISLKDIKDMK